jgi:tetratricopeptide (TPR) repeat protein
MSDIGYNDDVKVFGRKFHVQTASSISKGIAAIEVFEEGRVINKSYNSFERRKENNKELMEERIRKIIESVHIETHSEIQLLYKIAEKLKELVHAPSHVKLGMLFMKNNLIVDAIDQFEQAININSKEIAAYNNLGLAYIRTKDYSQAVKVLQKALEIEPGYADVHLNLGLAYHYEKQLHKGLDEIQQALAINPEYQIARYNLAVLYLDSILVDKDDKQLPEPSVRVERAMQQLKTLIMLGVNGMGDIITKVQKFLVAKDVESAVKLLMTSTERLFPEEFHSIIGVDFFLRFMYGGKGLSKRSLKKFEKDLMDSLEIQDDYADLWNNLGIVHLIQCRNLFLQALSEFNQALKINPNFEKASKNKKLVDNDGKEFLMLLKEILK